MRKWEDVVKDKLEEADGALAESVYAEFLSRRNAPASAAEPKRHPLVWVVVPAVAAALAAILLLRQPAAVPDGGIQLARQPSAPIAMAADSVEVCEPMPTKPPVPQALKQRIVKQPSVQSQVAVTETESTEPEEKAPATPASSQEAETAFIPETAPSRTGKMNVGLVAGSVAGGGGLLAAAIVPTIGIGASNGTSQQGAGWRYENSDRLEPIGSNGAGTNGETTEDFAESSIHYFPLKLGLSARIPLAKNLYISTGVDYSLYRSTFTFTLSGEKEQYAHYLGIPVRLDWVFASGKLFDVYLGGGLEGDVCVGATLAGKSMQKDGFGLSLQGAGGIQLNATKHLGFYVEPQLSWRIPIGSPVLETYRTAHPLQFNVAAGIRITIGK